MAAHAAGRARARRRQYGAEWGTRWNVGVVCGTSGLAVLDVDQDDDPDQAALQLLGLDELPYTPIVRTGKGRLQLY